MSSRIKVHANLDELDFKKPSSVVVFSTKPSQSTRFKLAKVFNVQIKEARETEKGKWFFKGIDIRSLDLVCGSYEIQKKIGYLDSE